MPTQVTSSSSTPCWATSSSADSATPIHYRLTVRQKERTTMSIVEQVTLVLLGVVLGMLTAQLIITTPRKEK